MEKFSESKKTPPTVCPICQGALRQRVAFWTSYCASCDYWGAGLKCEVESESDSIFDDGGDSALAFLDAVRIKNFNRLLADAEALAPGKSLSILDVGSATGLFLTVAQHRGHTVLGLEPNPKMANAAQRSGLNVIQGYFPDALSSGQKFDVIVFNDVIEHIPELADILTAVRERLFDEGLLLLNLPNAKGLIFNIGRVSYALGFTSLWERLWQTMFYTPHVHYFSPRALSDLAAKFGFIVAAGPVELPTISLSGLWSRICADKSSSLLGHLLHYLSALVLYPFSRFFPQDSFAVFYRKF